MFASTRKVGVMTPKNATRKGLRISPQLTLPLDAVTETFAILAKRRAGKSNAAVVLAEEMFDAGLPWVAVDPKGDWWGVRASGDGKSPGLAVVVFGGLHGDVPLDPAAGRLVADLLVEQGLTAVLDVSEMSKTEQRRFLTDFAERLYRSNREPRLVIAEEADEYIPQRVSAGDARMVGAWEMLIKRGGFRGLGVLILSQRSASLNKDVLSQVETLIAMRTPSPHDRKAILGWITQHEAGAAAVDELPGLESGEAWVFSPQWLNILSKVKFRRRRTFDSGATPKVGARPKPPATLADVDLAGIEHALSHLENRVADDDPKKLRQRIRELEKIAKAAPAPVERVEVPAVAEEALHTLQHTATLLREAVAAQQEASAAAQAAAEQVSEQLQQIQHHLRILRERKPLVPAPTIPPRESPARRAPAAADGPSEREMNLRAGAHRMVESLGAMAPLRLTKSQWGTVAKLKTSGGTWATYLSDIRRAGFLEESAAGYTLTDAGFDYLGGKPEPLTADELQQHYRRILRAGAVKMLDALIEAWPSAMTREGIGIAADLTTTGGTFATYLSDLVRNGLAERDEQGNYRATDVIMTASESVRGPGD